MTDRIRKILLDHGRLAKDVTTRQTYTWREMPWAWNEGYGELPAPDWRATVIDYGVKRNILRMLAGLGADITVVPAQATFDEVEAPDGAVAQAALQGRGAR